jgi:hypothetical protein
MSDNVDECSSPAPPTDDEIIENEITELMLRGKQYALGHANFTHKQLQGQVYLF